MFALSLAGCANIPEEAVTLSVTVGKDLEVVHQSHRALAEQYFTRMKADVDNFSAKPISCSWSNAR